MELGGRPRKRHVVAMVAMGRALDPESRKYRGNIVLRCQEDDREHDWWLTSDQLRRLADEAGRWAFQIDPTRPLIQATGERVHGEQFGFNPRALDGLQPGLRRVLAHMLAREISVVSNLPLAELHALATLRDALMESLGLKGGT